MILKKNFLVTKQSAWRKVARKKFTKEKSWQKYDLVKQKKVKNAKKVKGKKLRHQGSNQGRWIQSRPLYQLSYCCRVEFRAEILGISS